MVQPLDLLVVLALLVILAAFYASKPKRRGKAYPPGPSGWPLVGNVLDLPVDYPWLVYEEWSQKHDSPIVYAGALGQSVVVLTNHEAATELLEKRSAIYSDRPESTMLQEVMGLGAWNLPLLRYGPIWRRHRKCFNQAFHANAVKAYHGIQSESVSRLLVALRDSPEKFKEHINSHTGRLIMKAVYDHEVKPEGDEYMTLIEKNLQCFNEIYGNGKFYLVDVFPSLKKLPACFPGCSFQRLGTKFRGLAQKMVDTPFEVLKMRMAEGAAQSCMVTRALEHSKGDAPSLEELDTVKYTAAIAYSAGQDTTAATLTTFILAMTLHPDQQKKAQEEIDSVTRGLRLPDLSDKESLPCVQRILLETLRWLPAVPIGLPHRVMQEDEYLGHTVPEGSVVFGNIWSILHDEAVFPDPFTFNADRFSPQGKATENAQGSPQEQCGRDAEEYVLSTAFGFGRRICPGRWLALDSLWLSIAQILATYDILKEIDEEGREVDPVVGHTTGLTSHPKEFKCRFKPRLLAAVCLQDL